MVQLFYPTPVYGFNSLLAGLGLLPLDVDCSTKIVKKLKLTGVGVYRTRFSNMRLLLKICFRVHSRSPNLKEPMFRTVSGIRGQALSKPDGEFRATFEDKVLKSGQSFLSFFLT